MAAATEDPFDMGLGRASRISARFYPLLHFHVLQNHHSSLVLHTDPSDLMVSLFSNNTPSLPGSTMVHGAHQIFSLVCLFCRSTPSDTELVYIWARFSCSLPWTAPSTARRPELSINSEIHFTGHLSSARGRIFLTFMSPSAVWTCI
jgi:hypothetical protein